MQRFPVFNLEVDVRLNTNFRKVVDTSSHLQLVLMSLLRGEDIGMEAHPQDQFIRVEEGEILVVVDGIDYRGSDGFAMIIRAFKQHNVINIGKKPLKFYVIYSPPAHSPDELITLRVTE